MRFNLEKIEKYQAIPTKFLEEKTMTLKAKGLLVHIYSLPNKWDYTMAGLSKITGTGIKQIRSTIEELELFGYLLRKQTRDKNGKLDYEYIVYVNPLPLNKRKCLSLKNKFKWKSGEKINKKFKHRIAVWDIPQRVGLYTIIIYT